MSDPDNMRIKAFVDRVRTLDEQIKELSNDKADIYAEAKGQGYNSKALRKLVNRLRRPKSEREAEDDEVDLLEAAYVRAGGIVE